MKDLTGERNIVLGCLAMGMTQAETRSKYQEIVNFAGLKEGFIQYPMRTYSSGMGRGSGSRSPRRRPTTCC